MASSDPMSLFLSLRREMVEMKQKNEEEIRALRLQNEEEIRAFRKKNEEELLVLRQENSDMRKPFGETPTPSVQKGERSKAITQSNRSRVDKGDDTDEEESPFNSVGLEETEGERRHPFVDGILIVELPARWKGLGIDRYDGSTDPDEHIDVYETQMPLYTTNQAVMCGVLPSSLKGMALNWFTRLPPTLLTASER